MNKYAIGIVDDEESAVRKIKVTIKENRPENVDVSFKEYLLEGQEDNKIDKLIA